MLIYTAKHGEDGLGRPAFMRTQWERVGPKMTNKDKRQRSSNAGLKHPTDSRRPRVQSWGALPFGQPPYSGIPWGKGNKIQDVATGRV